MNEPKLCPRCGLPLPPDAPEGLCPVCLLKASAGGESTGAAESINATVAQSAAGAAADLGGPTIDLPSGQVDLSQPVKPATGRTFDAPDLAEIARHFPQLEVLELIGRGGMGAVYKVRQKQLDRIVALKILPHEVAGTANFTDRFMREARALAKLNHPNIVAVYDFGVSDGLYFILMEYVEGVNLRSVLRAGPLPPAQALVLVPQICEALQFAHEEGIVHRDIKPENILLDKKGRVKIADFGLAKLRLEGEPNLTASGNVMGTLHYMAPEQMGHSKDVDHRADIFSLGVVFYELLTGELPLGHFQPPSKRKVELDVRLDEVVLKSLEQEPARRYQKASDVKTQVEHICSHAAAAAAIPPPQPPPPPLPPSPEQKRALAKAAGAIVNAPAIALLILGALSIVSGTSGPLISIGKLHFKSWIGLMGLGAGGFDLLLGVGICYGAWEMLKLKSYGWAQAAAIMAIVPLSPFCIFGVFIGIWALVTLQNPTVRAAFASSGGLTPAGVAAVPGGAPLTAAAPRRWGWLWLLLIPLGLCVFFAAVAVLVFALYFTVPRTSPGMPNVVNVVANSNPSPQQLSEQLTRQVAELKGSYPSGFRTPAVTELLATLDTNSELLYGLAHSKTVEAPAGGSKSARELLHACALAVAQLEGMNIALGPYRNTLSEIRRTIETLQSVEDTIAGISDDDFQTLSKRLAKESFDEGKLDILRPAISKHRFSTAQAKKIVGTFRFDEGKIEAAEALYPRITDPANYHQILEVLAFPDGKQKVQQDLGL